MNTRLIIIVGVSLYNVLVKECFTKIIINYFEGGGTLSKAALLLEALQLSHVSRKMAE